MNGLGQDFTYGLRSLRRQRGFTALALLVLGSAIGLNTSLFTLFNAILLRPWPVPDADAMVKVFATQREDPQPRGFSVAEYRYLSEHARSFAGLAATREGGSDRLSYQYASGTFFDALRVPLTRGRGLRPDDDRLESPVAVAVLSHAAWQRHFDGDPEIVGRGLDLNGVRFTVVGVAAPEFTGIQTNRRDVWLPMASMMLLTPSNETRRFLTRPEDCCVSVVGRLRPEAARGQAQVELTRLRRQFVASLGAGTGTEDAGVRLTSTAMLADPKLPREILPLSGLAFFAVALVLLLACANVGNLVLARGLARRAEIAVRLSLGASRARVVRQLLIESLLLAAAAGAIGVALAHWLPLSLLSAIGGSPAIRLAPDPRVLAFASVVVVIACLASGLAPALHCTRAALGSALKERVASTPSRVSLRGGLLAAQVAISVVLLAGAGLLVRAVGHARGIDPGFATHGIAAATFDIDTRSYDEARRRALGDRLRQELEQVAGSAPVGLTDFPPLDPTRNSFTSTYRTAGDAASRQRARLQQVSSGYFDVLHIPIVGGRTFVSGDDPRRVMVVNESLARRYWPASPAIGQTLVTAGGAREIVGVVKDTHATGLGSFEPTVYLPLESDRLPVALLRDDGPRTRAVLAAVAARLDPRATVRIVPLADNVDRWLQSSRMGAFVAGGIGLLGLALATIGLAGVFAYAVQQRTREIGIRMALGARTSDVVRLVLGSGARALVIGVATGLIGAAAASQLLRSHLYGLSPLDPLVYAAVVLVLAAAGATATYLPARRALRVDPIVALRYE